MRTINSVKYVQTDFKCTVFANVKPIQCNNQSLGWLRTKMTQWFSYSYQMSDLESYPLWLRASGLM